MSIALVDYGVGNLHSAHKALERMAGEVGAGPVVITADPEAIARADRIVLPGDGAFPHCRAALAAIDGLEEALLEAAGPRARPLLGICVGMQLLASTGWEYEQTQGLDLIAGAIHPIDAPGLKIPHMGWNDLVIERPHPVLEGIATGDHVYFVHSFAMQMIRPEERLAHADYGGEVTALIARDTVLGAQFHPEKSQQTGLRLIGNFLSWRP